LLDKKTGGGILYYRTVGTKFCVVGESLITSKVGKERTKGNGPLLVFLEDPGRKGRETKPTMHTHCELVQNVRRER
jgi:hypothetical protein